MAETVPGGYVPAGKTIISVDGEWVTLRFPAIDLAVRWPRDKALAVAQAIIRYDATHAAGMLQ